MPRAGRPNLLEDPQNPLILRPERILHNFSTITANSTNATICGSTIAPYNSTQSVANVAVVGLTLSLNQNLSTTLSLSPSEIASLLTASIQSTPSTSLTTFSETFTYCTGNPFASKLILGGISGSYLINTTSVATTGATKNNTFSSPTLIITIVVSVLGFLSCIFCLGIFVVARSKSAPQILVLYEGGPETKSIVDCILDWKPGGVKSVTTLSADDFSSQHPAFLDSRFVIYVLGPKPHAPRRAPLNAQTSTLRSPSPTCGVDSSPLSNVFDSPKTSRSPSPIVVSDRNHSPRTPRSISPRTPRSVSPHSQGPPSVFIDDDIYSSIKVFDHVFQPYDCVLLSKLRGDRGRPKGFLRYFAVYTLTELFVEEGLKVASETLRGVALADGGKELVEPFSGTLVEVCKTPKKFVDWMQGNVWPSIILEDTNNGSGICMMKLIRERGLFRGFFPSLSRVGIHSLVTLNTMELLRRHFHFAPF